MGRTDIAARRMADAWRSGPPIRDLGAVRPRGREDAYAIQDAVTELLGLPAGAVILTGSLTEPRPVAPGNNAVARFDGGAEVRMSIACQ